jgi:mRNA interferase MazF
VEKAGGIRKAETDDEAKTQMSFPRRGDIYLVEFDPARGHEIQKTRPALIIQNDIGNRHSPVTVVAAITSKISPTPYPVEVIVAPTKANGLTVPSAIHLGQIRSVDRERLVRRLGTLDHATMRKVDDAITISLGLVEL